MDWVQLIYDPRKIGDFVRRRVAKLVAHLLASAALWGRIHDISQKYKMGDISKGVANTSLARPICEEVIQYMTFHPIPSKFPNFLSGC